MTQPAPNNDVRRQLSFRGGRQLSILLVIGITIGIQIGRAEGNAAPLPLDLVSEFKSHVTRSPLSYSPDGKWIAHTYSLCELVSLKDASPFFTASGVSLAEGESRMRARITNCATGEVIELGAEGASSWSPVWSPDGVCVVFYSDEGGKAGLWLWEMSTGKKKPVPNILVRPFFGFDVPQWLPDGRHLVCKILDTGSVQPSFSSDADTVQTSIDPDKSVVVRVGPQSLTGTVGESGASRRTRSASLANLAVIDIRDGSFKIIAKQVEATWFSLSPDGQYLAYSDYKGPEANSQQGLYDVELFQFATWTRRNLVQRVRFAYGTNVGWSPNSDQLAFATSGQLATGECTVANVTGQMRPIAIPGINFKDSYRAPLWDRSGKRILLLSGGKLWTYRMSDDHVACLQLPDPWQISAIMHARRSAVAWNAGTENSVVCMALDRANGRSGFFELDLGTGIAARTNESDMVYKSLDMSLDVNEATRRIAFVAEDMQRAPDIWNLDLATGKPRQVSHLNGEFEKYKMGVSRLVEWRDIHGNALQGTLLLPPNLKENRAAPLVVWVYGGDDGATFLKRFGIWGATPVFNFHILATRGYAVFVPSIPLHEGTPVADVLAAVLPGVTELIREGVADSSRVAVMGQSYGSYCVLGLITETNRFKAAVISAVIAPDLLAGYLENNDTGYYEHGQGRMGGTPWQFPERYRENSPIFKFYRIRTPLLIAQGTRDGLRNSDAVFNALNRLGQTVEYRIYDGESHVISSEKNVKDFWKRRLGFLSEHLGIPVDERGNILSESNR